MWEYIAYSGLARLVLTSTKKNGYKPAMQQWYVYILRCFDDTLYCGITTDIERRLAQHNAGTASKYTRARLPARMEAHVKVSDKSEALRLEIKVKKQSRQNKIAFLTSYSSISDDKS